MFQQVGQTALALLFLHRAHLLGDVVVSHLFRILVVANVVGESVVELTLAHILVLRQPHVSVLGQSLSKSCHEQQCCYEKFSQFHLF